MYQALYRKWRPQTFDQVVGQSHITETLKNQVKTGRLSHSYIFIGTRGTGKTTCARILAKAVNCLSPVDGNPCGECASCRGIADGSVLDVVELDAASNNGVDNVRALREEAVFSPAAVKKRVYIIDEVHMLSTSAFNALLKILEEPPAHLMFILATTELQKVPATILSRCQRHSFHRIDASLIASYLEQIAREEGFQISRDAAELIARLAEGGLRDALSLLDQCSARDSIEVDDVYSAMGLAGKRRVIGMLEHILRHETAQALSAFSSLWMEGRDGASFLRELSELLRDVLMLRVAPKRGALLTGGGYDSETLKRLAARMETEELIAAMETVQRYLDMLRDSRNPKTVVELCLISLCDSTVGESISALRGRIARLEGLLANGAWSSAENAQAPLPSAGASSVDISVSTVPTSGATSIPEDAIPPWETAVEEPEIPQERTTVERPEEPIAVQPVLETATEEAGEEEMPPANRESASPLRWEELCEQVAAKMPVTVRVLLAEAEKVSGRIEGDVLTIQADEFALGRLSKNGAQDKFAQAARELCGREIRVILSEKKKETVQRSIDDLKAFKEVRFL